MVDTTTRFISPEELDSLLKEEGDLDKRIVEVSKALVTLVSSIGNEDDAHTIRNISQSLISSDLLCERLWKIYDEIYTIWQRLQALITRSEFQEHEEASIKQRAAEIISDNLFQLQREVFFKIVNAKEVAEGEKNEDGPALLFPGIEKSKNSIIRSIQSQTEQLKPAAVDICKSFHGIAKAYVETEPRKPGERISFDTISQSYDRESKIIEEISSDISTSAIDSLSSWTI